MVGKTVKKRKIFKLRAPDAAKVCLAGSFNDWDPEVRLLNRDNKGVWKTSVTLAPGVYEYRFVVDGEWRDDPACAQRQSNQFGTDNCVVQI